MTTAVFFYQLHHEPTHVGAISSALWIFQGVLFGVALWIASTQSPTVTLNLILSGALLILAWGYIFLGRWLGQQEDGDA